MKSGAWNVRSLYRAGSFMTATRELTRSKLDLVGVQEVRWDRGGTVRAGDYTGRFIIFSVIMNIYNKKTKGPTLMELFTATAKPEKFFFFFLTIRDVRCVHHG